MKGIELPISTLVIVAIALIILLALVAMYFTGFGPFSSAVGLEGIRGEACRILAQEKRCMSATNSITIPNFDADEDNTIGSDEPGGTSWTWGTSLCGLPAPQTTATNGDNLASLCACYYSIDNEGDCKQLCGCP